MNKKAILFISSGAVLAVAIFGVILFLRAHQIKNATSWANRLRLIESAKNQWALEHDKHTNDVPTWSDISEYIYRPSETFPSFSYTNGRLISPTGEAYTIGRVDEPPICYKDGKIFILP